MARKQKRKTPSRPLQESFSLAELGQRLGVTSSALRRQVEIGRLLCDQQGPGRMMPWDPMIGRDAAIEFCTVSGIPAMRCM